MTVWVSGDIHFNHRNIAKYCPNRQTKSYKGEPTDESIQEMNELIISNWNSAVDQNDEVYILGDVCLGIIANSIKYIPRLNGKKHLIKGNHDKTLVKYIREGESVPAVNDLFESVHDLWQLHYRHKEKKIKVFMCHYPMLHWPSDCEFALNGHTHLPPDKCLYSEFKQMDVSLDGNYLFPRKLDDVLGLLSNKKSQGDHHK